MSLNSIMSSANSGLMAAQTGLRTVSDNIANINSPGYVRKVIDQAPLVAGGMGSGVTVTQIRRAADQFLQRASLNATASAAEAGVTATAMDRAQALFGNPGDSSSFFSRLDDVYAAFTAASTDAASSIRRDQAIDRVTDYLNEASRISTTLQAMGVEADSQIAAAIERTNQLLKQIDDLNGDISRGRVQGGDTTGPENVQSQLINELSSLMDVSVAARANGGVIIRASDGNALAGSGSGGGAAVLKYVRTEGASGEIKVSLAGGAGEPFLNARITGGEIRGLLDLRDRDLPALGDQLSEFVTRSVDELNRAHNAASAVPAPTRLTGRDTGMELSTAIGGFSGRTSVVIVNPAGVVSRKVDINFDAGTMSIDGGATTTAFTPASFMATLNGQLAGQGSASFANGALTLSATGTNGVAVVDPATTASSRAGKGFSHFFGLNDLVSSKGYPYYETGLTTTDPHGFAAGDSLTLRVADKDGARIRDLTVAVPAGGTMQDLLNALNANSGGVGLYGQFSLDADGALSFGGVTGQTVSVVNDKTSRGSGGPSVSELFGLGHAERASRVTSFEVRPDIAAAPGRLALATFDPAQAALGRPALAIGDGRGAQRLAAAGEVITRFDAVGGSSAGSMSVSRYAAEFAGSIGRKAENASSRQEIAQAVAAEADTRRSSAEGVNLDQELISMTTYQQAFSASARLVQAGKDLYDVLLQMVG